MAKVSYSEAQVTEWRSLLEGDLETLFRLIVRNREPLDSGCVRAATPILRRWLVEGLLGKLCRGLQAKPTLPALNNDRVVRALPTAAGVTCFITGGIRFNGNPVLGIYVSDLPFSGATLIPIDTLKFEDMKIGEFTKQKRIFFQGSFFSCEEIIKFVANKLGGVHHDAERDERQGLLDEAADAVSFGGPQARCLRGKFGKTHIVVEPEATEPLNGLHVEIIAAAASLLCVRLNGSPLVDFKIHKSLTSRISDYLGLREKAFRRSAHIIERGAGSGKKLDRPPERDGD